jgi:hypothetical protein
MARDYEDANVVQATCDDEYCQSNQGLLDLISSG